MAGKPLPADLIDEGVGFHGAGGGAEGGEHNGNVHASSFLSGSRSGSGASGRFNEQGQVRFRSSGSPR